MYVISNEQHKDIMQFLNILRSVPVQDNRMFNIQRRAGITIKKLAKARQISNEQLKRIQDENNSNGFEPLPEHEIAYKKLEIIAKALNFGWCPNWADFDECKYYPWFDIKKETPAGVGGADNGAALGVSVLTSGNVASNSSATFGGALASDDPTDTIPDGAVVA